LNSLPPQRDDAEPQAFAQALLDCGTAVSDERPLGRNEGADELVHRRESGGASS
jgi:hypothetical protein